LLLLLAVITVSSGCGNNSRRSCCHNTLDQEDGSQWRLMEFS